MQRDRIELRERVGDDLLLLLAVDDRRAEELAHRVVGVERGDERVQVVLDTRNLAGFLRELENRGGVAPGERLVRHQGFPCTRSARVVSTSRRFVVSSTRAGASARAFASAFSMNSTRKRSRAA